MERKKVVAWQFLEAIVLKYLGDSGFKTSEISNGKRHETQHCLLNIRRTYDYYGRPP